MNPRSVIHNTRALLDIFINNKHNLKAVDTATITLKNKFKALNYRGTAITKGKTPVPVCSPKLSPVGQG